MSCESSSKQTIHMICQKVFSVKNNEENKKFKMLSAAVVIGALGVTVLRSCSELFLLRMFLQL